MTTTTAAATTTAPAAPARTADRPRSESASSARPPARAAMAPLRDVETISPQASSGAHSHAAIAAQPRRSICERHSGTAIAITAPRRFALPRLPSGRNGSFTWPIAQTEEIAAPAMTAVGANARVRGVRSSHTGTARSPRYARRIAADSYRV